MTDEIARSRAALIPKGYLRAAVNLANIALVGVDPATGKFEGVSVELARDLSKRLGCRVEFVTYPSAAKILEKVDHDEWDVAFLAADPAREDRLLFSPAYALIEGTLVVREGSPYRSFADIDSDGVKICVTRNAAYDLYLARRLAHAKIVHASTPAEALDLFVNGNHDASAGIKQALERFIGEHEGFRVLLEPFLIIRQTIAVSRSHPAAGLLVLEFVEDALQHGFSENVVREAQSNGITLRK
ncbi:polar amino acid transport system substrate-binding protein [Rhizobium pisi]|uniref:Amino acid ABC transporter substrate-binding protein n=1 Tax=Rhizobium pisi TaxID=574561 RepID=A0A3R9BEX8_9HYPH|nr:transporter substrate-binding domain-containing protein [Rhizobium pisi]MBB3138663.1 polar amino acid transport system substrate-binding protein [Rhizobium pisi]RSB62100.1 amino acid ABC transporter substrate-binding protein [Rhizobium pisi]TCA48854.1 transporter substrate-binding domain-containing protein [Rhizobium pisi]